MVDVNKLKSHPNKKLFVHVRGVVENTKKITKGLDISNWAELLAIFHDLGKINPNFQDKFKPEKKAIGYTRHSYLSALVFLCYCQDNNQILGTLIDNFDKNTVPILLTLIAKHHGNIPDFLQKSGIENTGYILSKDEIKNLYKFLNQEINNLPIVEYIIKFKDIPDKISFKELLVNEKVQSYFQEKMHFEQKDNIEPLNLFLNTQFSFATLIHADKADAMDSIMIDEDIAAINDFCKIYPNVLTKYISKFKPDSELNILRTQISEESIRNIQKPLKEGNRVFELTAPTGSGKTIMLLSLASQIIEQKGSYRIMYALPFLSITEQVEKEVLEIFEDYKEYVQRIDSKSENDKFNEIQKGLDSDPDKSKIKELDFLAFQEQVFAYPFVITTFVRFFETLLSNHNATLLKLPKFSKSIFLLDEIQSLPPRLYTFFVAYLTKFCEKFDSYAIISTATQPNFELPQKDEIQKFFSTYQKPTSILDHHNYYNNDVFNRYQITHLKEDITIDSLSKRILEENSSVLVIVNTIDDSKELYKILKDEFDNDELVLLNTYFTPFDRKYKIEYAKLRLQFKKKIVLISTQLIEAGVDIDFPVLYRDFALVSSIVQSAGRCNRNGKLQSLGKVILFNLIKDGKSRANLIYGRGKDKEILSITKQALGKKLIFQEKELLKVQKDFFNKIALDLNFAEHSQKKYKLEFNLLEDIKKCAFSKIGKFQLIDEQEYGEPRRYFVPKDENDNCFEELLKLDEKLKSLFSENKKDWKKVNEIKYEIKNKLKKMSNQIVQVRLKKNDIPPNSVDNYYDLNLLNFNDYSLNTGINLSTTNNII